MGTQATLMFWPLSMQRPAPPTTEEEQRKFNCTRLPGPPVERFEGYPLFSVYFSRGAPPEVLAGTCLRGATPGRWRAVPPAPRSASAVCARIGDHRRVSRGRSGWFSPNAIWVVLPKNAKKHAILPVEFAFRPQAQ